MEKPTLLLVEDEKIIALDLKRSVEKLGYTVIGLASTGEKAIEVLETTRPDLILMDLVMPVMEIGMNRQNRPDRNIDAGLLFKFASTGRTDIFVPFHMPARDAPLSVIRPVAPDQQQASVFQQDHRDADGRIMIVGFSATRANLIPVRPRKRVS